MRTTAEDRLEPPLNPAVSLDPFEPFLVEASERFAARDYAGARESLDRAVELKPDRADLRMFQGTILYHLKEPLAARRQFQRAVELDPGNGTAHASLAAALMALGQFSDSKRSIREALRLVPDDLASMRLLGTLSLHTGSFSDGICAYGALLEKDPADLEALLSQGRCYFEVGELALACRNFTRVLALDPGHKLATENLALVRKRARITGQSIPDEAGTIREQFESLGPWFTRFHIGGMAYGGDFSAANDSRMSDFLEWHQTGGRLLDLGSFEGAQSLILAARPNVGSVVGVDAKQAVVARANLVKELMGAGKVSFQVCDVEQEQLEELGRFDVAYCSDLLCLLAEPWRLIKRLSSMTDRLFLSTHYLNETEPVQKQLHYCGMRTRLESHPDLRGGVIAGAFRPTFKSLLQMLTDHQFKISQMRDYPEWPEGPLVNLYCEK